VKKDFQKMILLVKLLDSSIRDFESEGEPLELTATINIPINKKQGMSNHSLEIIEPLFDVKENEDYFDIVAKIRIIKLN